MPFEEACSLAEDSGMLVALETSAKEARNIEEAFVMMAEELLKRNGMPFQPPDHHANTQHVLLRNNSRPISSPPTAEEKPKSCC